MKAHRIGKNIKSHCCPTCNIPLTGATGIDSDDKPIEGDISVCFGCGEILTFNADLTHAIIKPEKLDEIKCESLEDYMMIIKLSKYFKKNKL